MDSVSHVYVANLLLDYVEQTCGVTFDRRGFLYGNLKPDLKATYLTKRHYPSLMFDEVMEKLRVFAQKYTIGPVNGHALSVDLGEICHFMTDFFCFPHNDDIYQKNLFMHYLYEKRTTLCLRRRLTQTRFHRIADSVMVPTSLDDLIERFRDMHEAYRTQERRHCIDDDLHHICQSVSTLLLSVITFAYESEGETTPALALA